MSASARSWLSSRRLQLPARGAMPGEGGQEAEQEGAEHQHGQLGVEPINPPHSITVTGVQLFIAKITAMIASITQKSVLRNCMRAETLGDAAQDASV